MICFNVLFLTATFRIDWGISVPGSGELRVGDGDNASAFSVRNVVNPRSPVFHMVRHALNRSVLVACTSIESNPDGQALLRIRAPQGSKVHSSGEVLAQGLWHRESGLVVETLVATAFGFTVRVTTSDQVVDLTPNGRNVLISGRRTPAVTVAELA